MGVSPSQGLDLRDSHHSLIIQNRYNRGLVTVVRRNKTYPRWFLCHESRRQPAMMSDQAVMMSQYFEVRLEGYNAKGEIYLSEIYRYAKRKPALQKLSALKRHHPSSSVILVRKEAVAHGPKSYTSPRISPVFDSSDGEEIQIP
jgi:hypothetical protein